MIYEGGADKTQIATTEERCSSWISTNLLVFIIITPRAALLGKSIIFGFQIPTGIALM